MTVADASCALGSALGSPPTVDHVDAKGNRSSRNICVCMCVEQANPPKGTRAFHIVTLEG